MHGSTVVFMMASISLPNSVKLAVEAKGRRNFPTFSLLILIDVLSPLEKHHTSTRATSASTSPLLRPPSKRSILCLWPEPSSPRALFRFLRHVFFRFFFSSFLVVMLTSATEIQYIRPKRPLHVPRPKHVNLHVLVEEGGEVGVEGLDVMVIFRAFGSYHRRHGRRVVLRHWSRGDR